LILLGCAQSLLGAWLVAYHLWRPVTDLYFCWDRVSEGIVAGTIDPAKLDAQLIAAGRRPSGLTVETVRADPASRPGGYSAIADWLLPPQRNATSLVPSATLALSGLLVIAIALARPEEGQAGRVS